MTLLAELSDSIIAAGIPVLTLRFNGVTVTPVYAPEATQAQKDQAQAMINAWVPPTSTEEQRSVAKQRLTVADGTFVLVRAVMLVLLDEVNLLRTAAGLTPRTAAQMKTAINTKITNGSAD